MIMMPKWFADLGLKIHRFYYRQLFHSVYRDANPSPSWFDHRIDLYYHWPHNLCLLERGILPRREMFKGCSVLDLFCGDGFFSCYFYSTIAGQIDAVDNDPSAIAQAKRYHSRPKVHYRQLDAVQQDFPRSRYDIIIWFEGIENLDVSEYEAVAKRTKAAIGQTGVLLGSTPIFAEANLGTSNWEHRHEFTTVEQLREFLHRDFIEIKIDTTVYPVKDSGEPFTGYCLRALYPFAQEILVVEGAAPAAAKLATTDSHSTDGTLETLYRFKAEEDPKGKVLISTREGFWSKKDEI